MNINSLQRASILVLLLLVGGCTNKAADFCTLLTVQEVGKLHPGAVVGTMEEWYKNTDHPTWYCSWKDREDKTLLSLSVSFATSNSSYAIANTFSGGSRVAEIPGVGKDAAAIFYKDKDDGSDRFTLFARNHKWTLDIRSSIEGDENGEHFEAAKELADVIFTNLDINKVFSKLQK